MGGCYSANTISIYKKQLSSINLHELKSQWSAINSYKIKRIFERFAHKDDLKNSELQLCFSSFCQLFPEFIRYQETQKKRIFEIFDRSNNGYLSWSDFYDSISICYFGEPKVMALILFIIFDQSLEKQLNRSQLSLLVDLNANYLIEGSHDQSVLITESQQIANNLIGEQNCIDLQAWLQKSGQYFDFNQFRRFFNIFKEEKLEKQLVQNFHEWNELFNQEQGKYISYIISFKWFEAWKIYVESQYGISFSLEDRNPVTMKSIKTKKSLKTNNSNKSRKNLTGHFTSKKKLKIPNSQAHTQNKLKNSINEQIKNFDMIRCVIGERPKQIYNYFLQGQFIGTFKSGLVENRDYVFVSEKVWNYLTQIYSGFPEFRRTGFDQIQLNPKIIRIFSGMFKGEIDYASQVLRQVSNTKTIEELMSKSLQIQLSEVKDFVIFYRTFGMSSWEEITSVSEALIQITTSTLILMVYLLKSSREEKQFRQKYLSIPRSIREANLGDILIYEDNQNKIQKQVVFFNRNLEGKYIIHFIGESYLKDFCLSEKQFMRCCKICHIPEQTCQFSYKNEKIERRRRGIQGVRNLSFITAVILQFLENDNLKQLLQSLPYKEQFKAASQIKNKDKTCLIVILAYINRLIKANMKVDPRDMIYLVDAFFPGFRNFDITQINSLIGSFCEKIKEESAILKCLDIVRCDYEFSISSKFSCLKCGQTSEELEVNQYVLSVDIPETNEAYYKVIFVPFNLNMSAGGIKRVGFQLPKDSTLKDYKNKLINLTGLVDKSYILVEVEGDTIIKNFSHIKDDSATLQSICLRQDDNIYAYQVCLDYSIFLNNHFSFSDYDLGDIEQKDLKIGDFIDCKSPQRGWIFGKIVQKDILPYTYQQNLKIIHKSQDSEYSYQSYSISKNILSFFPSQSYKNCEQYQLKIIQRVFSEANNEMVVCNMPLVIVLPSWMKPKEFQYLIFLQVRRFITDQYSFQMEEYQTHFIGSNTIEKSILRQATKIKVKKFKQYLYGKNLPYQINLIDNSGHCLICLKFVKSCLFKGQSTNYCNGCSLSNNDPISWQVLVNDMAVAVDWKNIWAFRKDVIWNDSSYVNLSMKKKKDIETIQSCLQKSLRQQIQTSQMLCCGYPVSAEVRKEFPLLPNMLIVSLNRIKEHNGFKRKIKRPVYFGDESIILQNQQYKLVGIIGSRSYQNNVNYTTYIKQGNERWLAFKGERVQIIRKQEIDKRSTLIFFYQKVISIKEKNTVIKSNQKISHEIFGKKPGIDKQKSFIDERLFEKKLRDEGQKMDDQPKSFNKIDDSSEENEEAERNSEEQTQKKQFDKKIESLLSEMIGQKPDKMDIDLLKIPDDDFEFLSNHII